MCYGNTPSSATTPMNEVEICQLGRRDARNLHLQGTATGTGAGSALRMRGTLPDTGHSSNGRRITPACAGNTVIQRCRNPAYQDHPRVRGEHGGVGCSGSATSGSPPRAGGTRQARPAVHAGRRITPACAGNTRRPAAADPRRPDHPRVRGEHELAPPSGASRGGSPPRARGTRSPPWTPRGAHQDHPRVRGEHMTRWPLNLTRDGSPPRARGTPLTLTSEVR